MDDILSRKRGRWVIYQFVMTLFSTAYLFFSPLTLVGVQGMKNWMLFPISNFTTTTLSLKMQDVLPYNYTFPNNNNPTLTPSVPKVNLTIPSPLCSQPNCTKFGYCNTIDMKNHILANNSLENIYLYVTYVNSNYTVYSSCADVIDWITRLVFWISLVTSLINLATLLRLAVCSNTQWELDIKFQHEEKNELFCFCCFGICWWCKCFVNISDCNCKTDWVLSVELFYGPKMLSSFEGLCKDCLIFILLLLDGFSFRTFKALVWAIVSLVLFFWNFVLFIRFFTSDKSYIPLLFVIWPFILFFLYLNFIVDAIPAFVCGVWVLALCLCYYKKFGILFESCDGVIDECRKELEEKEEMY